MRPSKRQPTTLIPKGLKVGDETLQVVTRMAVRLQSGGWQEVGPLQVCHIPWSMIYETEIGDMLNSEHARRLAHYDRIQAAENAMAQDPLF